MRRSAQRSIVLDVERVTLGFVGLSNFPSSFQFLSEDTKRRQIIVNGLAENTLDLDEQRILFRYEGRYGGYIEEDDAMPS